MIEDLNLFLGSNTDAFVNWLHQVLEKLQEVTLSTNSGMIYQFRLNGGHK